MGSVYKRGKNWYIDTYTRDGTRVRKSVGTSKKLTQMVLADIESQIARDTYEFKPLDLEIEELLQHFLDHSKLNNAETTYRRYWIIVRNFRVYLAVKHPKVKLVSELKSIMFEKYKEFRRFERITELNIPKKVAHLVKANCRRAKTRTINNEIKALRSVFNFGIKRSLINYNPCKNVSTIKDVDASHPRFLSREECKELLDGFDDNWKPIYFTFLNTGMRLGELIHLQWKDIDLRQGRIKIRHKSFWRPKSSERDIPINQGMADLLKKMRKKKQAGDEFVFTYPEKTQKTPLGSKLRGKFVRNMLVRTAKKTGVEELTKVHDLRHTFASQLVMAGVDLPTVQKLLGHSDIQTTMIYAHLAPDHLKKAVDKLEF